MKRTALLLAAFAAAFAAYAGMPAFDSAKKALKMRPELSKRSAGGIFGFSATTTPVSSGEDAPGGAWEVALRVDGLYDRAWLYDWSDRLVAGPVAASRFIVAGAKPWSPESPVRYKLVVEGDGDFVVKPLCFRTELTEDGARLINGKRLWLRGLDVSDDFAFDEAAVLLADSRERFGRVLASLKAVNMNALRVPNACGDDDLRRLCDEYGICLVDDVEVESNGLEIESFLDEGRSRALESRKAETRYAFRDWTVKATNYFQRVVVANRNRFVDATGVGLFWTILRDGEKFAKGSFDLRGLGPGEEVVFDMPDEVMAARKGGASVSMRFEFLKGARPVAEDQVDIAESRVCDSLSPDGGSIFGKKKVSYRDLRDAMAFETDSLRIEFSRKTGLPYSIKVPKKAWGWSELLEAPMTPGMTDCLGAKLSPVSERGGALSFTAVSEWQFASSPLAAGKPLCREAVAMRWTIYPNGTVACVSKMRLEPASPISRAGCFMPLARESLGDMVEWFGRGPMKSSANDGSFPFLGRWKAKTADILEVEDWRRGVRGVRLGPLAIRSLGAPFSFCLEPVAEICCERPDENGEFGLAFTIEPFEGALTARTPEDTSLPALPEIKTAAERREQGASEMKGEIAAALPMRKLDAIPQSFVVDLGETVKMKGLLFRSPEDAAEGRVSLCKVETSADGEEWREETSPKLENSAEEQDILFYRPVKARYYRFTALEAYGEAKSAAVAGIEVLK